MKTIILFFSALLTGNLLFAQNGPFVNTGSIEYEKSVNMYALARETLAGVQTSSYASTYAQGYDQYKKNYPQFAVVKSILTFANNKTLYTPGKTDNVVAFMGSTLAVKQLNTVYTDLSANKRVVQKDILDGHYLLTDSLSKITWKIIGGSEDIAGYRCREAHGVIQDSVYVVAFYTDRIRINGGPESFSGLPGMILKLVLPHEHITWTATKVTGGIPAAIEPPKKGKPLTYKEFYHLLKNANESGNILKLNML